MNAIHYLNTLLCTRYSVGKNIKANTILCMNNLYLHHKFLEHKENFPPIGWKNRKKITKNKRKKIGWIFTLRLFRFFAFSIRFSIKKEIIK